MWSCRAIWLRLFLGTAIATAAGGCGDGQDRLFEPLDSGRTGIDFVNSITPDDTLMNPLDFFYVYNGGGVAVGDLNGDGRQDLYFTGNMVENRLYLNRGDFRFEDATAAAGVAAAGAWSTGVALVDINRDDKLDIYLCVGGPEVGKRRANRLYVNMGVDARGIPTFQEQAERYGIADTGYTTHAAFFDYDRDGDLDLYVLNTAMVGEIRTALRSRPPQNTTSRDRLYRNDGVGSFTDVSESAGIQHDGYGLGIAIGDVNNDGWPDVYVANDFLTKDVLYANDGDGTFTNRSMQMLKHQSYSSMGVDLADFNNDAHLDILVLDMLPKDPGRQRLTSNTGVIYEGELQVGRNTLQLNNGAGPASQPAFSDIAHLAGVAATGWSWAPLFADFDNDSDRDLFVTNGYGELVTHLDFVHRTQQMRFSGTHEENRAAILKAMQKLPEVRLSNMFFENGGNLAFTDRTTVWAKDRPGISNGVAFADLDQDGDLDLVTNNINRKASVLRNRATDRLGANSLRVELHGPGGNRAGLGAKLIVHHGGTTQYHDHSLYRGYQSTVESVVHFGLGADSTADTLQVIWPDGRSQLLTDVKANQVLTVRYDQAASADSLRERVAQEPLFREVAEERGLMYRHVEYVVADFAKTPLLPHKFSRNGPGLAVGDADGNGLDDVFVGADPGGRRKLFMQSTSGYFVERSFPMNTHYEDAGSLFFDADGDGDVDLYVASGGSAAPAGDDAYQDRLYVNDGAGSFSLAPSALPVMTASSSSVVGADYDGDDDIDLFVGGRVRPGSYPLPPRSYLLRNDSEAGQTLFTDVTEEAAPELAEIGLVTSALWTDFDGDDRVDLLVAGEWMPLTLFKNMGGRFSNVTGTAGLQHTAGWWNSLAAGDFDRDGDIDYVAGNLGLNTRYAASLGEPVRAHAKDFDRDGRIDPVLSYYIGGTNYPAHGRDEITEQLVGMIPRFPSYQDYAEASFDDVLTKGELEGAYVAEAVRFETSYVENRGDGTFDFRALPIRAQFAPVFGIQAGDCDGDGHLDLLMVGNWGAPDVETGRADAFVGALLRGDGTGRFSFVEPAKSGFFVDGDAKGLAKVSTGGSNFLVLATQNGDAMLAFTVTTHRGLTVPVRPLDHYAVLSFKDGSVRKDELTYGSTYLSQSSRVMRIPADVEKIVIIGSDNSRRSLSVAEADSSGS